MMYICPAQLQATDTAAPTPRPPRFSSSLLCIPAASTRGHPSVDGLGTDTLTHSGEQEPSSFRHSFSFVHSRCLVNILNKRISKGQTLSPQLGKIGPGPSGESEAGTALPPG